MRRAYAAILACTLLICLAGPASAAEGDSRVVVGFKGSPDTGLLKKHGAALLRDEMTSPTLSGVRAELGDRTRLGNGQTAADHGFGEGKVYYPE